MARSEFLAKVAVPSEFKLAIENVFVFCEQDFENSRWILSALDDSSLSPDNKEQAIDFILGEHNILESSTVASFVLKEPSKFTYAADNYEFYKACSLVSIKKTLDGKWKGNGFFHNQTFAVKFYIRDLRHNRIPVVARGALFHWIMLRMSGHAASGAIDDFEIPDVWTGFVRLEEDDIKDVHDTVALLFKGEITASYNEWEQEVRAESKPGYFLDSHDLKSALVPPLRAQLHRALLPDAAESREQFALQDWNENCESQTHTYYREKLNKAMEEPMERQQIIDLVSPSFIYKEEELQRAVAISVVAAKYIDRRVASFEAKKAAKTIHAIAERNPDRPMFAEGFYSAMQDAILEDINVSVKSMPLMVAANLSRPAYYNDRA